MDPMFVALIGVILAILFFFFLLIRKTMLSFKEGMRGEGR